MSTFFLLDRRGRWALLLLLLAAAALYLFTLDTGLTPGELVGGDLITHQYAQVQARPSNAPGYPLYTMGGWLWFHAGRWLAPAANPIPLLSSYSTVWALLALALFFLLLYRLTQRNLVVSVGISVFYAITYFFWYYSVTTEQYTSAVLHTLVILALALAWDAAPTERKLYLLAFVLGLGLAHLVTVLFVAPGVLLFVLSRQPDLLRRGRLILRSLLLALAPLLSYAFIYLRGAQHPEWRGAGEWPSAWVWFLSFISTQQGRDELTWTLGPLTDEFPRLIWVEVTPLLLILGVMGWALLGRRHIVLFSLTALIYLLFAYIDRLGNWYQVIMPFYPIVLLGAGVMLARAWRRFPQAAWRWALVAVLIALILPKFAHSYPRADQRHRSEDTGLAPGEAILAAQPPERAAIVAGVDEKLALDYLTGIWGRRRDVTAISTSAAATALAENRPLLVTAAAVHYAASESGLPLRYTAWGPGLLWAVVDALPAHERDLPAREQVLGDGLELTGIQLTPGPQPDTWQTLLALRARAVPQHDWALSLRLLVDGVEIAQQDHPAPALGFTPTTSLRPGEMVHDAFAWTLPAGVHPDALRLILYRARDDGGFENLVVVDAEVRQ